ncbi:MAG: hypothetical protein ACOC58_04455 [Chloroflexota bacterium]
MTAIVAWWTLKSVAVVADCRVTCPPERDKADDCLQKLYQIGDRFVIGFAGPLQGAYEVLDFVRENWEQYRDPPIADNLLRDVERWIRFKYRQLRQNERRGLSFILAAVEPRTEKQAKWVTRDANGNERASSKPSWFPFIPECHITALKPAPSEPNELHKAQTGLCRIIGSAEKHREAIEATVRHWYGFVHDQPHLQMQAVMGVLTAKLMPQRAERVGGLLQCALLGQNGVEWIGYGGVDVALLYTEHGFVQYNTDTGETLPLMSIWQWARGWEEGALQPGSLGTFEDARLREAIEKHRPAEKDPTPSKAKDSPEG